LVPHTQKPCLTARPAPSRSLIGSIPALTYTVNGDLVVVTGGQTVNKTVKVDGEFAVSYKGYGDKLRTTVKHTWTQPKGCTSPSPSTSTSTVVPVPSISTSAPGGLPVTGPNTAFYAGGAALLLVGGGTLLFMARRRRVKFEA
jgi:LPXTG-motif cell wall-anchored protein